MREKKSGQIDESVIKEMYKQQTAPPDNIYENRCLKNDFNFQFDSDTFPFDDRLFDAQKIQIISAKR